VWRPIQANSKLVAKVGVFPRRCIGKRASVQNMKVDLVSIWKDCALHKTRTSMQIERAVPLAASPKM